MRTNDLQHLIATRQYFVAVWRLIDATDDVRAADLIREVSRIVNAAIREDCLGDVERIIKAFPAYIDLDTYDRLAPLLGDDELPRLVS